MWITLVANMTSGWRDVVTHADKENKQCLESLYSNIAMLMLVCIATNKQSKSISFGCIVSFREFNFMVTQGVHNVAWLWSLYYGFKLEPVKQVNSLFRCIGKCCKHELRTAWGIATSHIIIEYTASQQLLNTVIIYTLQRWQITHLFYVTFIIR